MLLLGAGTHTSEWSKPYPRSWQKKMLTPPTQDDIGILLNGGIRRVFILTDVLNGRYQSG